MRRTVSVDVACTWDMACHITRPAGIHTLHELGYTCR